MKSIYLKKISFIILMICIGTYPLLATDYYVKAEGSDTERDGKSPENAFATLNKAVNTAADGDAIFVSGKLENVNVTITGRQLTIIGINDALLKSTSTAAAITINALLDAGNDIVTYSKVRIENIAMTGLSSTGTRAAIMSTQSSLKLVNCRIYGNKSAYATGVCSISGNLYMSGCLIEENEGTSVGGGIYLTGAGYLPGETSQKIEIIGSVFKKNKSVNAAAISFRDNTSKVSFTMINSTVCDNLVTTGQGIIFIPQATVAEGSEFTFINTTFSENIAGSREEPGYTDATHTVTSSGSNAVFLYWNTDFKSNINFYNCIFVNNMAMSDVRLRAGTADTGKLTIKGSIISSLYLLNDAFVAATLVSDATSSFDCTRNAYDKNLLPSYSSVLGNFNTANNACPLASVSSYAYNLGDASLLAALDYHTDQLKQYRSFANGKCHAGAVEWIQGDAIAHTAKLTPTEITGYSSKTLESKDNFKFTGSFTENHLENLKNALGNNKTITSIVFENSFPETTKDYFTNINPNCLKFIPSGSTVQAGWNNFIAENSALTPIVLTHGFPFNCPEAITAVGGVSYTRNFASTWESIALPFAVNSIENTNNYTIKEYLGVEDEKLVFKKLNSLSEYAANKPYIINVTGNVQFNGAVNAIVQTPAASSVMRSALADPGTLNITYNEITETSGMYVLSANGKSFVAATNTIVPFTAYFQPSSSEATEYEISKDTSTNTSSVISSVKIYGINDGVVISTDQAQTVSIFSIDGRKVKTVELVPGTTTINLSKGIYIVQNKKVAVR